MRKKIKIAISYPPLESEKGTPCLTQNRQFQWFSEPTYIYPVIPAWAATLLKQEGYEVFWDDGITEGLTYEQWKKRIIREKPDLIALETKTPVIKRHWQIIEEIKNYHRITPEGKRASDWQPILVLMGDHVTARPQESLKNSKVDFVLVSGDYDFLLLNLVEHLSQGRELEGGFWFRQPNDGRMVSSGEDALSGKKSQATFVNSGPADLSKHNLDLLPRIDRELTRWQNYAYQNGNFKFKPGAYLMSGRDCWWGRCSFCSWTTLFPGKSFRTRSVPKTLDEVGHLISLGVKEIMEDTGSLPVGDWLLNFCQGMIARGYHKKVVIDCNLRINAIQDPEIWKLMKKAGFRLILFGLESANQETLNRLNKNLKIEEVEPSLKMCKEAGLEPHITTMIGYPWETKKMAENTIQFVKKLFKKGYINTLQATLVMPYPGTPLYKYLQENDLLVTKDYERFDQREQVIKSELSTAEAQALVRKLYKSFFSIRFMGRKILSLRSSAEIKYFLAAGRKWLAHLTDFSR